jgi:O-Antigen ligase
MSWHSGIRVTLALAIAIFSLFEFLLQRQSHIVSEYVSVVLSLQWILLVCLAVWCGILLFLTFSLNDLPLIGLLLIAITVYFVGIAARSLADTTADASILLAGVMLGKGTRLFFGSRKSEVRGFLVGLVVLLAISSWWHLDMSGSYYHGPRWRGLWDSPNDYGMLMGTGLALAIGLLAASLMPKTKSPRSAESAGEKIIKDSWNSSLRIIFFIAAGMMAVGLVFSCSRGAWLGMAVGLLYLAKAHGKLKWKYVALGLGLGALGILFFWGQTPDSAPWYVKRADLGRPSVQHRASAWRAGLEIMRDHPFGVGWNNAVSTYEKSYAPPEGGAPAITTNDYMMIGTELGILALLCFVSYAALCLRGKPKIETEAGRIQATCRTGAIVLLVAFWFDGGLFTLPTAAVFWILLELGTAPSSVRRCK